MAASHILLIGPANLRYVREAFLGVAAFAAARPQWELGFETFWRGFADRVAHARPDAIIALFDVPDQAADLRSKLAAECPVLSLGDPMPEQPLPVVRPDDAAVARLAAEHLLSRGFRRIGFVPYGDAYFSARREAALRAAIAGHDYRPAPNPHAEAGWAAVGAWLRGLPKPCGVVCPNDHVAHGVAKLARQTGVRVPDDVALVGVDDDEILCSISTPPLSSVDPGSRAVGYEAARVMDLYLRGEPLPPPNAPVFVPPVGVVVRASSDILAIEDREVADAVRFIRANAHRPLSVADVLEEVPISRRAMERRFRAALGHGPADELRLYRVQRAKDLLAGVDLPMPQVAKACGFGSAVQFSIIFRRVTGQTPSDYRRSVAAATARPAGAKAARRRSPV
jgi:LacI family transcriptional regulator